MKRREKFDDYPASQIEIAINEWIRKDRYKDVFRLWLLHGMTYEEIAEAVDMSDKQVSRIIDKYEWRLLSHL